MDPRLVVVMTTDVTVPHLHFPLRVAPNGSMRVVEQDTVEEIVQSVSVFLRTKQGERIELPGYGVEDPTFKVDFDLQVVTAELLDWEPRAEVIMTDDVDIQDELVRTLRAHVIANDQEA